MQTTKKDDALLEACVVALGAFIERNTPETRAALAKARTRFREAAEAELGTPEDQQLQKDLGAPDVTLVRPIENRNRACKIGPFVRSNNLVDGAIHCDGDNEASNTGH